MGRLGAKAKAQKPSAPVGGAAKEQIPVNENMDDVEYLRKIVQNMTKTIAPLGKSMDFISEDVEIMTKEYDSWRNQIGRASCRERVSSPV